MPSIALQPPSPKEPSIPEGHPGAPRPAKEDSVPPPQPLAAAGKSEALRGSPNRVSLQAGLLGWYCGLKQVQLGLLQWMRVSLELLADFCCCWAQSTILACTILLLLTWKLHAGARKQMLLCSWALQAQVTQGLSLLRSLSCCLETLVAWVAWWPSCCFVGVISHVARALEVLYEQAGRVAAGGEGEAAGTAVPSTSAFLWRREERL